MHKAIMFHDFGDTEVLRWENIEVTDPGPGEARIRHEAVGVNFIDIYQRSGLYKVCLLYTSPSPRDGLLSRMPSSA